MKILVANLSGNMGKTTLVKHLLAPRMPSARIVCIESTNAGSDELNSPIRLNVDDEFSSLVDIMALEDELIVDLGSSEAKEMIRKLKEYESSIMDFDMIVVPVIADPKAFEDTLSTVMTLNALSVPRSKIYILFNKIPAHMSGKLSVLFGPLIDATQEMAIIDPSLTVYQFEIYNSLKGSISTISDCVADQKDWKSIARDPKVKDSDRIEALSKNRNQKAAPAAARNLDAVFDSLVASR
jgi:hypothetical protein